MRPEMKLRSGALAFCLTLALLTLPGIADWNPDEPYKWVQPPDLSFNGMDVMVCHPFILGDDFECNQTGPLTQIHLWGSWLYDYLPFGGDPMGLFIHLSIHKDIPAWENPDGFSIPGEMLWDKQYVPGEFIARIWEDGIAEGWLEPPEFYIPPPADTVCWQYNFMIPPEQAFIQEGTPEEPVIYWLVVQARTEDSEAQFGWKSSEVHWNDDAVWGMGDFPYPGPWNEMIYPPGHEMQGMSVDLAFVIVGEEIQYEIDYGDAPDNYRTTIAMNGPSHVIQPGYCLGYLIDAEPDGQPTIDAMGDDNNNLADEEGVINGTDLIPGQVTTIVVRATAAGYLDGWLDYNGDGSFGEAGDRIWAMSQPLIAGLNTLNFTVPTTATVGIQSYARLRFSSTGGLNYYGPATDGEVEDYLVDIGQHDEWKWNQHPDVGTSGIDICAQDPYILADDFLCSETGFINEITIWGSWLNDWIPFGEWPGGVSFILSFHKDIPAWENPDGFSIPGEVLWLYPIAAGDFDVEVYVDDLMEGWMWPPDDYIWPGDHVCWCYRFFIPEDMQFLQEGTPDNPVVYWLDVQALPEDPDAIFGWKTSWDHWNDDAVWGMGQEPYNGPWGELIYPPQHEQAGESIDLAFRLRGTPVEIHFDYGDAPDPTYPTLFASDGARHVVPAAPRVFMGPQVDTELDGQPHPQALGDDLANFPDEDGVFFAGPFRPGAHTQIIVDASVDGFLDAWVDWHADGSWAEPIDRIFTAEPLFAGNNILFFTAPETGMGDHLSFARFRFSTDPTGLNYTGVASDGEVEDYMVEIEEDVTSSPEDLPERFGLFQNLPNPFNPWTSIHYEVPAGGAHVVLEVLDVSGRRVAVLVDEFRDQGRYDFVWMGKDDNGQRLGSGIYLYRLKTESWEETRKMTLLR